MLRDITVPSTESPPRKAGLRKPNRTHPDGAKATAVTPAPRRILRTPPAPARTRGRAPNMAAAAAEQKGCGSRRGAPRRRQSLPCRMELAAPAAPSRLPFPHRAPPASRLRRRQEPGRLFVLCEGDERVPLLRRRRKTAPSALEEVGNLPITTPARAAPLATEA